MDRIIRAQTVTRIVRSPNRSRVVLGGRGLPGPPGAGGAAEAYTHTQASALAVWTVNHNLGARPIVTVFTPGGVEVEADILHLNTNQLTISFASPQAGSARCI